MSSAFAKIAFTPSVRAKQTEMGSRTNYARFEARADLASTLGEAESGFIAERDGFYQASVSETGWPYVQYRGGPAGFLKVLDDHTLGYADFRGNMQYISVGNLSQEDRVSLILMDYANRRRLKILGRARLIDLKQEPQWKETLADPSYQATLERAVIITVEAVDWNCPQHITPRFTEAEIREAVAPLHTEIAKLKAQLAELSAI